MYFFFDLLNDFSVYGLFDPTGLILIVLEFLSMLGVFVLTLRTLVLLTAYTSDPSSQRNHRLAHLRLMVFVESLILGSLLLVLVVSALVFSSPLSYDPNWVVYFW